MYRGEETDVHRQGNLYAVARWVNRHPQIDMIIDAGTVLLFGWATVRVLTVFT